MQKGKFFLLIFIAGVATLLIAGGGLDVPNNTSSPANTDRSTQSSVLPTSSASATLFATPSPTPQSTVTELTVTDGKLTSGPKIISVTQGDTVVVHITSNTSEELHLHGYDITLPLVKATPAELRFTATLSGRFEYELEKSHTVLGAIEVQPK